MQKTPEQSADARISDFEEKVRHLEQERDAAVNQVKELQAALREKEAEVQPESSEQEAVGSARLILETILENVPDGLAISDLSGRVTYCSQEGIKMSGMTPEEMSGSTPEKRRVGMSLYKPDGTTPADSDELPLVQVLRTGKPVRNRELLIRHRDGKEIPIRSNAAPIRDQEGNLIGAIHLWRDVSEQKRTEKALRENHEKFRTFFMTTPVLTTVSTVKEGRFLDVNRAFETVTGFTREEAIGKTSYELNIWRRCEDRDRFGELLLNNTPLREEEAEITTKFGEKRTVLISAETIELAGEKCIIASAKDITSRKQSEERLRALVSASSDVLYRMSPDWNEMRQLSSESFLAQTTEPHPTWLQEYILPEDQAYVAAIIKKVIRTKSVFELEHRARRADGSLGWAHSRSVPILDAEGDIIEWIGAASDITERKRAEEALRRSEEKFRAVFEQAAVGIGRVGFEDARWIDVNDSFCRMLGYSPEEMLATPWPEITHPDDLDLDLVPFHRMAAGELDTYSVEKRFIHKLGRHVWARLTLSLVRDSQGRPDYEVAVIENITERKHAEETLKEAKAAAEEASQAKSEFLANMSHEIRTPMTVFMAAVEHLLQTDRNPERRHLLGMADQSAKRLRSLIDDILDISRIEARKVEIEEAQFDLRDCIREAVEMFALPAREKGLQLEMEIEEEVPRTVVGDPDRLGQVLINLIGNAVKFTHKGVIRVCVQPRGGFVEFAVADTGIGIPEDKLDLLFQSFSQIDASFTRQYGGTGLGLAISKELVELMGGEISVQSHKREGSVFTFSLPLKSVEQFCPAPAAAPPEAPAEPQPDARILLAEDDSMIREMITIMLSQKGLQIDTAETGGEALDKWASGNFDLILMDLQMPEMNGLEATRNIREKEAGREKRTCIIGLTAHARREITDECLQAGMDQVLTKPVQIKDLYSAIDGCLPG